MNLVMKLLLGYNKFCYAFTFIEINFVIHLNMFVTNLAMQLNSVLTNSTGPTELARFNWDAL